MKKILKIVAVFGLLVSIQSCNDGEELIDDLQSTVERGAILRTVQVISNELPIGVEGAEFSVELEEQDEQDGGLLDSVDVYVSFTDGSPDNGDTTGAGGEALVTTITAAEFSPGPFGLPRTTLTLSLDQMLAAVNLSADNLFGGDVFNTRLVLKLTDGRTFTSTDVNGNIASGSFFLSPFSYNSNVVCPVPDDYFLGTYLVEKISSQEDPFFPNYGSAFGTETVEVTGSGAARSYEFSYFPTGFDFGQVMNFTLSCGNVLVMGTAISGTLGCGDGSIGQSTPETPSTYNLADDSVLEISFEDFNPDAGCGTGSYPVTLRYTKQ